MEQRKLGTLDVSLIGLGCNNFGMRVGEEDTKLVVDSAIDAGITFFDTADVYGLGQSEVLLGRALGSRRDEVLIATKFGNQMRERVDGEWKEIPGARGGRREWVERAVEDSLRRLGTDRIDLYQMHVPDREVPIDETLEALTRLVEAGKVREIGCSNFSAEQIDEAASVSRDRGHAAFASVQNQYSLLERRPEDEVLPACERHGIGFIPYFPLASGLLTGKYRRDAELPSDARLGMMARANPDRVSRVLNDRNWEIVEGLEAFARDRGHTLLELAMSWLASRRPVSSIIAGATKPEQVHANAAACGWQLTPADLEEIDRITQRVPAGEREGS